MKYNSFLGGFVTSFVLLVGCAAIVNQCTSHNEVPETCSEESVETKVDTIPFFIDTPVPRDSAVVRYIDVPIPAQDIAQSIHADTLLTDSITISLPITQKVYEDSIYTAWVSGYEPALDSIRIYQPVTTITKTITNTEIHYKTKRWGVGVQAGLGVTPNRIEPYIGIGVTYNIFSW